MTTPELEFCQVTERCPMSRIAASTSNGVTSAARRAPCTRTRIRQLLLQNTIGMYRPGLTNRHAS